MRWLRSLSKGLPVAAIRSCVLAALLVWMAGVPAGAGTPGLPVEHVASPTTVGDLQRWVLSCYDRPPAPESVSPVIQLVVKEGLLDGWGPERPELIGFFSQLMRRYPEHTAAWFELFASLKGEGRAALRQMLWMADTEQTRALLVNDIPQDAEAQFKQPPPDLFTMDIDSPEAVMQLWGAFFATGDERLLKRIVALLPWAELDGRDPSVEQRRLVGANAMETLFLHMVLDQHFLGFMERQLADQPEPIRATLERMIVEAKQPRAKP